MSEVVVLDASAVLAFLQRENGQERVAAALKDRPCWVTTVNTCEVLGKLCEKGMPLDKAQLALDHLKLVVVDFNAELARLAAGLRVRTKTIGASLGDRACLALAQRAAEIEDAAVVYTTEQAWGRLDWPFRVVAIR